MTSPPPPRGSTRVVHQLLGVVPVSPAPAGIHPRWAERRPSAPSLPRPRGDPPVARQKREWVRESPPPPRGSTRSDRRCRFDIVVSPAPAGIHPIPGSNSPMRNCLPRPRGDPPPAPTTASATRQSPPPPRGSTQGGQVYQAGQSVSPAPAGIHPGTPGSRRLNIRLPRPRGDPPHPARAPSPQCRVSPPPQRTAQLLQYQINTAPLHDSCRYTHFNSVADSRIRAPNTKPAVRQRSRPWHHRSGIRPRWRR